MNRVAGLLVVGCAAIALQGCLAKTAISAVTLPVKVASSAVDAATTSQSEADQKRGREIRQREERLGRLQRDYEKQLEKCQDGDRAACDKARLAYAEMQQLAPAVPVEP